MNLFKIFGTIEVKDDEAKRAFKNISAEGEKTTSALGKIGTAAGKVGKAIAAGLAAGATAMAGLTVKALNATGNLEQNIGGAESVFKSLGKTISDMSAPIQKYNAQTGEVETSVASLEDVATQAYQNMGVSTSDYLATVNKMGALFQGAGFETQEALNLSSSAMQRAADVASIMGIDTSAALEAVAGAAKGNFTMMDNLGVAMNDTTLNAYALEKGIGKTTQEMTNQEKIGLAMELFMEKTAYAAGNYAKENETLAGSLGTAKAALTNFLDGSGDVEGIITSFQNVANVVSRSLQEILPRLVSGLTDIAKQLAPMLPELMSSLLPAIVEGAVGLVNGLVEALPGVISALLAALPALIDGVQTIVNALIRALPEIIQSLVSALPSLIPQLIDGLVSMIVTLCTSLPDIIQPIIDNLPDIITSLVDALLTNIPILIDGVIQMVDGLIQALPDIVIALIEMIPTIVADICTALTENIPILIDAAMQMVMGIVDALPEIITALVDAIPLIIETLVSFLVDNIPLLVDGATQMVGGIIEAIPEIISGLIAALPTIIGSIISGLFTLLPTLTSGLKDIFTKGIENAGKLLTGAWDGIISGVSSAWESVKGATSETWDNIKSKTSEAWSNVKSKVSESVTSAKEKVATRWNEIKEKNSEAWSNVKSKTSEAWDNVKTKMSTAVTNAKEKVSSTWDNVKQKTASAWDNVKSKTSAAWDNAKNKISTTASSAKEKAVAAWNNIKSTTNTVFNNVKNTVTNIWNKVKSTVVNAVNNAKSTVTNGFNNIKSTVSNVMNNVKATISNIWENIKTTIRNKISDFKEIGSNLIKGLWNGINDTVGWIIDKIGGFCSSVLSRIKGFFGIHSPSTVMRDSVGKELAAGVAEGISQNTEYAELAAEELGQAILDSAQTKLDNYKVYNNLTLADEIAFWDGIRKECAEGTQARIDADAKYYEAKKDLDEKLADAEQQYRDAIEETRQKVKERTKEIADSFQLFEEFVREEQVDEKQLISSLESQVSALRIYRNHMDDLREKIGDTDLFADLEAMGIESLEQVIAINNMSETQLAKYVELYNERTRVAEQIAKSELADENAVAIQNAYQAFSDKCAELGVAIGATTMEMKGAIETAFVEIADLVGVNMEDTANSVTESMSTIPPTVAEYMQSTLESITNALADMKTAFETFSPKMKMPHFKISGTLDVEEGTVPTVDVEWYAKAMKAPVLMDSPTIFGYNAATGNLMGGGETGSEVVSGTNTLMGMIKEAVTSKDDGVVARMERLIALVADYLPQIATADRNIVLDSGAMVGAMAAPMNEALGRISARKDRGR